MRSVLSTTLLPLLLSATSAAAQSTITADFEGEPRTWYSVSGEAQDGPYFSSVWSELADERTVMIGGLDDPDPPVETFSRGDGLPERTALGDYTGSGLTIVVQLGDGDGDYRLGPASGTQVIYAPDANDMSPEGLYTMSEGSLSIDALEVTGETIDVRGRFSGRMQPLAGGDPIDVTDGRFEVRGIPSVASMLPG